MRATIKLLEEDTMGILSTFAQAGYYYEDSSYYYTPTSTDEAAIAAVILTFFVFTFIFAILAYVLSAVCLMRIFQKAGIEQPWAAWVPFYNNWKLLELGGQQGFWAILAIIPVVNIVAAVFMFIAMYHVGLKLEKEGIFVLFAILLSPVWLIWLAFDKSTWHEEKGAASLTPVHVTNKPTDTPKAA